MTKFHKNRGKIVDSFIYDQLWAQSQIFGNSLYFSNFKIKDLGSVHLLQYKGNVTNDSCCPAKIMLTK